MNQKPKMYYVIVKRGNAIDHSVKFNSASEAYSYGRKKENESYVSHSYYNEVNDIYRPTYEKYVVDYHNGY